MLIDSQIRVLGTRMPQFPEAIVKTEPMLFDCDLKTARKKGGRITKEFLDLLPSDWLDIPVVIDSRVHMLMPGMYPGIPGWHHDDVPRTRRDGQPNYDDPRRARHITALVNGALAPTEFALGKIEFPPVREDHFVYGSLSPHVDRFLTRSELISHKLTTGNLVQFNDRTWHRATPAVGRGWRWFVRISRYYDAAGKAAMKEGKRSNEIRKQVQAYIVNEHGGW